MIVADMREANALAAAEVMRNAGYDVSAALVDATTRDTVHEVPERAQSGHCLLSLSLDQNTALVTTRTEELLTLPFLQPDQVRNAFHA